MKHDFQNGMWDSVGGGALGGVSIEGRALMCCHSARECFSSCVICVKETNFIYLRKCGHKDQDVREK